MSADEWPRVREAMSTPVRTTEPETSLVDAAQQMRTHDISALLVTTEPLSIVTSTDVLDAVAAGQDVATLQAEDVMTTVVETIGPDAYLQEAAGQMSRGGVKHLPVVDGEDCVGMVTSTDITSYHS
jgi:CBS domain-containing protein